MAALIAEKCACVPIATCLPRRGRWCRLAAIIAHSAGISAMTQFNDTELTAAVIRSFEETPDPRVKFLLEELVKSLHDFVRKTDLTFGRMGLRDRFSDPRRPEMHPDPAGIHPAVRRARGLDAGRCGQPSRARRRHRDHGARPVLCRRTQTDAARLRHLGRSAGRTDVRAKPGHRSRRATAGRRSGRCLARRRRRLLRFAKAGL